MVTIRTFFDDGIALQLMKRCPLRTLLIEYRVLIFGLLPWTRTCYLQVHHNDLN
jgi:hypothetical protein